MAIVYNVDVYGSDGRVSAAADFVELLALTGRVLTLADLSDFFADSAVQLRRPRYTPELVGGEDEEIDSSGNPAVTPGDDPYAPARDAARRVVNMLGQRARILRDLYPFILDDTRLRARSHRRSPSSPYTALLALATAHAYRLGLGVAVTEVFEDLVARVLKVRIPRTSAFGAIRRRHGSFAAALAAVGRKLLLPTTTTDVALSTGIKDGGADTLSHLDWGDDRVGRWTFVGQVTCARSDAWESKAFEASRGRWDTLLGDPLRPIPFLAVPHHVEDSMLRRLVQDTRSLVLDRLRLVRHLARLSSAEKKLTRDVLSTQVEYL